jgi:hypothetical protein
MKVYSISISGNPEDWTLEELKQIGEPSEEFGQNDWALNEPEELTLEELDQIDLLFD